MINGKSTEYRIGKKDQSGLCFAQQRKSSIFSSRAFGKEVWCVSNSGISLYPTSQGYEQEDGDTGNLFGIYCQNTSQLDYPDKKICKHQRDFYKQSCQSGAGRFFSKERSWAKNRGALKYHSPTIECRSKSFLRFTIFLYRSPCKVPIQNLPILN